MLLRPIPEELATPRCYAVPRVLPQGETPLDYGPCMNGDIYKTSHVGTLTTLSRAWRTTAQATWEGGDYYINPNLQYYGGPHYYQGSTTSTLGRTRELYQGSTTSTLVVREGDSASTRWRLKGSLRAYEG